MTMKFESLRGFRDIYPEDAEPRENMFSTAKRVAHSFGFQIIDFPSLEPLDLYRIKSGDELVSQTFSFVDKGGREVTMVPEATPSVVRMLTSKKDLQKPVRWFSLPKIWRYEEPQSGRLREHVQFNADLFGPDTPDADAEIIGLAASILDSLGLSGNYEIRMNHRGMMEKILKSMQIEDAARAFSVIDRFRKLAENEFIEALGAIDISGKPAEMILKLAGTRVESVYLKQAVSEIVPLTQDLSDILDRIAKTMEMVSLFTDSRVVVDFSIVRGLSYYTGIVFEAFDVMGELRSILGGGRYNSLSTLLSGQEIPAVGFGMGDVVLELLLRRNGLWNRPTATDGYYVCMASDGVEMYSMRVAAEVRKRGKTAVRDSGGRKLSSQLRAASAAGLTKSVIIGTREAETESVTIKDMASGKQSTISYSEFLDSL